MKRLINLSLIVKFVCISFFATALGGAFVFLNENTAKAEKSSATLRHFAVDQANQTPVAIERSGSPWINLKPGEPINSDYVGDESAIGRFESGSLRPATLATTDFNFDGYNDVISGYAGTNGGIITLHQGSKEAFSPEDPQVLAGIKNGNFPVSFERQANVIEVPVSPDFIAVGNFIKDSSLDLIVASRGGSSIYIFSSEGNGSFGVPREITLNGAVTALAADRFDASKAFTGLTVATETNGGQLVVFNGSEEISNTKPQRISIGNTVSSLILASADGSAPDRDLFILANGEISRIPQIGKGVLNPTRLDLPYRVNDFAIGEFVRDRRAKAEIAVLADNGSIYYLQNGSLDRRPFTEKEMRANFRKYGRGRATLTDSTDQQSSLADNWTVAEAYDLGINAFDKQGSQSLIQKSYITGNSTEDLLIANPTTGRIQVMFKEPVYGANPTAFTGDTLIESVGFSNSPVAVLPVRLNVMGQQGIVVLESGQLEPTPIILAPNATFVVSKAADTADGTCNADCSLREAKIAANGAAGADMITFGSNFTHQLTIAGANENTASTGDLDVTQALTVVGNGSANTILQAGTTTANGIDKIMSINPAFTLAFATSISGVTMQFGRNPSGFTGDGFGGAFDWEGTGTGTLVVSGVIVTNNRTTDGDGGGITITNSTPGVGNTSYTNTTLSGNVPARIGAASPVGGGIFAGTATHFAMSNVTISGNNVNGSAGAGEGGGIFTFGPSGAFGTSTISNATISGNAAPNFGGGIRTAQIITFTAPLTFSSNTSGSLGGALWNSVGAGNTTTISKATFSGNSATTNGGAIYNFTGNLNVSFSRFAGNTGGGSTGLKVDASAGTANVTNNWWSCNAGPSAAPCNTASANAPGTVNFTPWIVLRHIASPTTIVTGQTSALTADFLRDSAGGTIAVSNLDVLIGLPITFNGAVLGTLSGAQATIQASGTATATFTSTGAGAGSANAVVDGGTATAPITITNTATWDGSTSSDWHTATNWTTNFTPTATNAVNLPSAGVTNEPAVSSSDATVASLTINSGRSIQINSSRTLIITGSMAMNGGNVDSINSGTLLIDDGATLTRSAGIVNTPVALRKDYTGGAFAPQAIFTYPVGTSTGFSPVTANVAGNGSLTVQAVNGTAPSAAPGLNDATTLDRYWQLTETGDLTASLTFTYLQADVDGTETNYRMIRTTAGGPAIRFPNGAPCPGAGSPCVDPTSAAGGTIFANPVSSFNSFWTAGEPVAPTAANVTVSGRVFAEGGGLRNAVVTITDSQGVTRSTRTSSFGNYSFTGVEVGRDYVISVAGKGYTFQPRLVTVNDNVADLDFTASP